jgi:hypothetical protein
MHLLEMADGHGIAPRSVTADGERVVAPRIGDGEAQGMVTSSSWAAERVRHRR